MDKSPPGSRLGLPSSSTPGIPMRFSAIPRRRAAESVRCSLLVVVGTALVVLLVVDEAEALLSPLESAAAASLLVEEVDV